MISHAELVVSRFKNMGDKSYDYLSDFLSSFLVSSLKSIPFIILTEEQKEKLISDLLSEEYLVDENRSYQYGKPLIYVNPRLYPEVHPGEKGIFPVSFIFTGEYHVEDEDIYIKIYISSKYITDRSKEYFYKLPLNAVFQRPENIFLSYVKSILNYRVFTVSLNVRPNDSIVYIDNKVYGLGSIKNILLASGSHQIHIHRDGYQDYYDIINVLNDNFKKDINLKKLNTVNFIRVVTDPPGAQVYLNEEYMGKSPILVKLISKSSVITLVKEGFNNKSVYPEEYKNKNELVVRLTNISQSKKIVTEGERYRKKSKLLYYTGIGFLASSILMSAEYTVFKQKAELYRGINLGIYQDSINKKNLYGGLAVISALSSIFVFTISFDDILEYFKKYESRE